MITFYSHGKLLLTGEYVVLDGALALGLPTKKGQSLTVEMSDVPGLIWKSIDASGKIWFEDRFDLVSLVSKNPNDVSKQLGKILQIAKQLNPEFLSHNTGFEVTASLEFHRDWGLGSSSTLINNIAKWAHINAYNLLELTFGGSGYDIACAMHSLPISYQIKEGQRIVVETNYYPKFSKHLFFVHLNRKQNSREGIFNYELKKDRVNEAISKISAISKLILNSDALVTFEGLINRHEAIISKLLDQPTIKQQLFKGYIGSIKSLGAWGGDFILVTSKDNPTDYFKDKGFHTILAYKDMILN